MSEPAPQGGGPVPRPLGRPLRGGAPSAGPGAAPWFGAPSAAWSAAAGDVRTREAAEAPAAVSRAVLALPSLLPQKRWKR